MYTQIFNISIPKVETRQSSEDLRAISYGKIQFDKRHYSEVEKEDAKRPRPEMLAAPRSETVKS